MMVPVNNNDIAEAIQKIGSIENIMMDVDSLVDDVFFLSLAYTDAIHFHLAVNQICDSLQQICKNKMLGQPLVSNLSDWRSYHFQSRRVKKQKADLRIVFKDEGTFVRVRAFGNRHTPTDFYKRIYNR